MTGLGQQMAEAAEASIRQMVQDFGHGYISAVEQLHGSPELQDLARTSEIDAQFLAAQIACMGIGSAPARRSTARFWWRSWSTA